MPAALALANVLHTQSPRYLQLKAEHCQALMRMWGRWRRLRLPGVAAVRLLMMLVAGGKQRRQPWTGVGGSNEVSVGAAASVKQNQRLVCWLRLSDC